MAVNTYKLPPLRLSVMMVSFSLRYQRSPGGWRVDACSLPPASVSESGDEVFIFAGLAAVLSSDMLHMLCAVCVS